MPLEGFGSEASLTAIVLLGLKVARDYIKERRERKSAAKVVNGGNPGNPGRRNNPRPSSGGTSTDLVLHELKSHGDQLRKLNDDMTDVKVNLAKVNTKLEIK